MKKIIFLFMAFLTLAGYGQVTNSAISGTVKTSAGLPLEGASIEVKHLPTGSKYLNTSDKAGRFAIPSVRPGGPYTVTVSFMGFQTAEITEINAPLGGNISLPITLAEESNALDEVVVKTASSNSFNKGKTGASQQFSKREINAIPITGSRSINDITKYNANAGSGGTFGGQDARLNNFTIDGSVFNNGFGLGNQAQAGGRTGSTAISLDAIEQLQVNIAPFDVRQTGFTGSGINAVTRSGTNEYEGSVYSSTRSNRKGFVGTQAGDVTIVPAEFNEVVYGARFGAPIIKDKLFIFGSYERVDQTSPATTWTSTNSPNPSGQVSTPTFEQMQGLSNFMQEKFNYTTGPWENFDSKSLSQKFLIKLDWNISDNHKFSIRYVHHDSESDELLSNSQSLGFGNRRTNPDAMSFQNGGYTVQDNARSIVAQLESTFSNNWSNSFLVGYDMQNEPRGQQGGGLFPTIDILNGEAIPGGGFTNGSRTLIGLGLDPFTPGNKLDYSNFHVTNNLTKKIGNHTLLAGVNYERFASNNSFFPGSNGVYVFNSLDQFYNAANESIALNGAPSVVNMPRRFQYRYSALPGGAEPLQIVKSNKIDLYVQDDFKVSDNLKMTVGVRASRISFDNTALENPVITALTFANGEQFNTGLMPKPALLFEPRVGFNLNVKGNSNTIIRGGTGVFTGKPPYVMLSNAVGNNGVLTGFIDAQSGFGFTANPGQYHTPANAQAPSTFDIAVTDRDYKFPQAWKTTLAVEQKLPFGFVGTVEGIFNRNINEIFYYNANQDAPVGTLNGSVSGDDRPLFANNNNGVRINDNVANNIVLSNSNEGYFYSATVKLEYPYKNGIWGSLAYTRSDAYDLMSAGSIAAGSWTGARSVNGNNDLERSLSDNNTPHRIVGLLGYKIEYGKKAGAATSFNIGYIGEQSRPFSYTYSGDLNGDRVQGNDLLFVPNQGTDLRFVPITQTVGGVSQVLFTEAQQQAAFNAYIDQDSYLSSRRGQYVERNSNILPMLHRFDFNITQDFFIKIGGKKNSFQFRADIINFGNLLNKDWGVTQRPTNAQILAVRTAPSAGNNFTPSYTMATQTDQAGNRTLASSTFQNNASVFDVWQAQFTLRYTFGN
jgi:hypothetical protein